MTGGVHRGVACSDALSSAMSAPTEGSLDFLQQGGEMGMLMRQKDWENTSLGPPEHWPQSLRTVVRLMLNTGHPTYIW
jgi:hypothetical protein